MNIDSNPAAERPWLRRFSKLLVLATLCLIFLGGQVKSHEAGLAVPDWPNTYGYFLWLYPVSDWVGNIFHEHVHRLVASLVGVLCIVLAIWVALRESRRWVKLAAFGALGLVILQGVLGGITVLLYLPTWVSVSHAVTAQSFFMLTIFIAYALSKHRRDREQGYTPSSDFLAGPVVFLVAVVYIQLILGALMRHTESGLAIPDFPAMGSQYLPWFTPATIDWINAWRFEQGLDPVTLGQVWIHFLHRLTALVIVVAATVLSRVAYAGREDNPLAWRTVLLIDALIVLQVALGAFTIWSGKLPVITSLHVANGAAVLGVSTLLVLNALPLRVSEWRKPESYADDLESVSA